MPQASRRIWLSPLLTDMYHAWLNFEAGGRFCMTDNVNYRPRQASYRRKRPVGRRVILYALRSPAA